MNPIYRKYKERFIQISGRNRSLYLKNIIKKYSYDIGRIIDNVGGTDGFMEFLWHYKRDFRLVDEKIVTKLIAKLNAGSEEDNIVSISAGGEDSEIPMPATRRKSVRMDKTSFLLNEMNSLRYLKREVEECEKETGSYELYVGFPFVFGMLSQDVPIKAPLMLFPVTMSLEKEEADISLISGQPIMLNKALILAYSKEHNLRTDSLIQDFDPLSENTFAGPSDVLDYLNKKGFKFKFTRKKSIIPFSDVDDFPAEGLEVRNMAVLGRFPLANSMYNDYLALERENLTSPSIEALLSSKPVGEPLTGAEKRAAKKAGHHGLFGKKKQKNPEPVAPLFYEINDLDYTQEHALSEITTQNNIVIYGPPGTGKSQTIVNIISDALCKKRRVLVVSQKRAALDVVFNRLGKLNDKAMLIPDPEKDKVKFFERLKDMHSLASSKNYDESFLQHKKVELDIHEELRILENISKTLFTKTEFGITLQEMYAASTNIGKDDKDYRLYEKLKASPIINRKYGELSENLKLIKDKNLLALYIKQLNLIKENAMIRHVLPDIDMHTLKAAQAFITDILSTEITPYDVTRNPYSRYLVTFYLEEAVPSRRSIARVADIITKVQHPTLTKWINLSAIPPLWPAYPFLKHKFNEYKEDIKIDLNISKNSLEEFEEKYKLFATILDREGYAMTIGSLMHGNKQFLKNLLSTLENYVKVRDMNGILASLAPEVKELLEFGYKNSDGSLEGALLTMDKILPIRIYHEIIKNDAYIEQFLSKTVAFEDLRSRIIALKADQRELSKRLAVDIFAKQYADYFHEHPNKDFLYEMQKQRGLKPIRVMMEYFEDYLMNLFPCWLLSPEVVSTIFPLKPGMFDLVVFDEASQIFIENALPAIYRGKKVVVAGDNKQLRPATTFVKRVSVGEDAMDENYDLATQAALEVESLLDLATSRYYPVYLSYHYRSQYSELIDFSNAAFYDNRLQVAPNISRNTDNPPIERIKVKGIWDNRHNREEALAIVKLLKSIFRERQYNESIGIVTFNLEQKEYIEDILDEEAGNNRIFSRQLNAERNRFSDGENTSIFVKNLENVQGDERDIIIFSVGYAKNYDDKVVAQFGSLSTEGGENRLNVAITRARKKVYIVTSIEPEELDRGETYKNNGARLLRKYLQYARAVSCGSSGEVKNILKSLAPVTKSGDEMPLGAYEEQIKEALEKMGYEVDINLGNTIYKLSLGVFDKNLNRYVLGIECDYRAYMGSDNVLERDIYRFKFLNSKGWTIKRVWSRDWWLSRNKVLDSIVAQIESEKRRLTILKESES